MNPPLTHVFGNSALEQQIECSFGDTIVPVRFVQAGVVKCTAPQHKAGFVPIVLLRNGENICVGLGGVDHASNSSDTG